jgi:hypothetical protein
MATFLRRDDWVTDAMGNALSGASVYVCSQPATTTSIPPSPLVQLYSDPLGADPIAQPVLTDGYGHAFYYVAPGTYTIVYSSPQILEVILADQTIGSGNVSFPITIAEGGTNATTASQALINLGAAASGANADITSMIAIGSSGGSATTTTFNANGWQYSSATFASGGPTVQVANQAWTGAGYTGYGIGVISGGAFSILGNNLIGTSGTVRGNTVDAVTTLSCEGTAQINTIESNTPGTQLTLTGQSISGAGSVSVAIGGNNNLGQSLLAFGTSSGTYPTQTTVGAAGGASALPATPLVYIPVKALVAGVMTEVLIPAYTV